MSQTKTTCAAPIALAATHVGLTGDNPSVGCVIVRDGQWSARV
jgi:pyrimidine deaminase RibD-like protein